MIPVRLDMRNFMSYTDVHEPLDFTGIHVACLSGDNGHGKSTILDAITWALWGKARARTADELIHLGRTEMEVQFEFMLDAQRYRVIRKRDSRGRGQTVLELVVYTGEGWRPLTGNTVGETEQQIQQLLRMSYETFTHSSFIMQGKADTFTTATPSQRKQVLAEILGLSYYDELEGLAREQSRARQEQASNIRVRIDETEREIARRPELEVEKARCEQALEEVERAIETAELKHAAAQASLAQLVSAEQQLAEVQKHLASVHEERGEAQRRVTQTRERLTKAEKIVARSKEADDGYSRLIAARQELETLNVGLSEHSRLTAQTSALEREIAERRAVIETESRAAQTRVSALEADAALVRKLSAERAELSKQIERLSASETRRAAVERERHTLSERVGALRSLNERLRADMVSLRERLDQLNGAEACPLCRADLSPERHQHVTNDYTSQGTQLAEQFRKNGREVSQAETDMERLTRESAALDLELADRSALQQRFAQVDASLTQAQKAVAELQQLRPVLDAAQGKLKTGVFAADLQQTLEPLARSLQGLAYDFPRHEQVRKVAEEFKPYEAAQTTIQQARGILENERPRLAESEQSLQRLDNILAGLERQVAALTTQTAGVAAARTSAESAEAESRQQRRKRDSLADALAAARQQLQFCERQAEVRADLERDLNCVLREQGIYADLALALGKNGVQAMLIDTAIPELDEHANQLLSRMTDGRMNVKLEMQKPRRTGGMAETLDIKISDELGTRGYELYSGGEAFRVNFALRIALSRLLARRAGASLQTLVIDEGFGSQDADGRDRLVDAIKAIQDDFEKILVITHIPELKDVFPVRIEITKTPAGSVIALT